MYFKKTLQFAAVVSVIATSGCATYRNTSNIEATPGVVVNANAPVLITEGNLPNKKYKQLGPIEVSVKKLTAFHTDPTREQANAVLKEKARIIGADAVINVVYESGVGFSTWGYMDAKGTGVKIKQ